MILNINKEKGWTSFDVVAKVKGILIKSLNSQTSLQNSTKKRRSIKVGHAGTLDPLAEGVLLVLTDNDTKKQSELMNYTKEYLCEISFGISSDSYDLDGRITHHTIPQNLDISKELEIHLPKYIGEFDQQVPAFSAVKIKGKRLYDKARTGDINIDELPVKKVHIYSIEKIDFYIKGGFPTVKLLVSCGKGTYIRSLANDLGKDLGIGGILVSLIRKKVGDYKVEDAITVAEFEKMTLEK